MTRKECLEQAMGCVLQDRASQYGGVENNFEQIADLWEAYLHAPISALDVAMMMALLKVARAKANPAHADSFVDLAGYAACGAELSGAEKAFGKPDGGCCQNGKDHANPRVVEWVNKWNEERKREEANPLSFERQARVFAENNPPEEPEGSYSENPDSSPEFQRGDRVEVQMVPDSSTWASAVITAVYRDKDSCEWRYCVDCEDGWAHVVVPSARVRPVSAPRAEGCEALVEKDAPQTKEELMQRIVDSNPSVYPRTPTGEELAEMAEEEPHG